MNKTLKEKIKEALSSVLPITAIVLVLSIFLVPMEIGTITMFLVGALFLIVGMGFFSLGADMAMIPLGEEIGKQMVKTKWILIVVFLCFFLGFIITIAEPDLQVLARQVPAIPDRTLILTVASGVAFFLVVAMLRIFYKVKLRYLLLLCYALVFGITIFAPPNFIPVSFDSGGVTTGPITVPFIMALGLGIASIRSDRGHEDDSFGLVALCSIGPILAVLLLGIVFRPSNATYTPVVVPEVATTRDVMQEFLMHIPEFFKEVSLALLPILGFFIIFQMVTRSMQKRQIGRILIGFLYTFIGLLLFLVGVNVGFIPVGNIIGADLATSSFKWLLIPIGMVIGFYIVAAEPAVHILNKQVEEVSEGAISQKAMNTVLSIGVSLSLGLSMLRILADIPLLWFLLPGYGIALLLSFFSPPIFTGIAFDSGGVVSGPMTSTFLLPFAMGACEGVGGNVLTNAFGIVAMVAMIPLIAVQIMGLMTKGKQQTIPVLDDDEIVEIEEEQYDA